MFLLKKKKKIRNFKFHLQIFGFISWTSHQCRWTIRNQQLWNPTKRVNTLGVHLCGVRQGVFDGLVRKMKTWSCRESLFGQGIFVPSNRSVPLKMWVIANLYDFGYVGNECWGVIDFNDLLPVGPLVTLLLI